MAYISRKEQREQAFFLVFEEIFHGEIADWAEIYSENVSPLGDWAKTAFEGVRENKELIDAKISENLDKWKINRIPKVNLAILRLAVYEILFEEEIPEKASINEAVELAKKYSGEKDSAFVNGVLGGVVRGM